MENGTAIPAERFIKRTLARTALAVRIAVLAALIAGAGGCTEESSTPGTTSPTAAPAAASTPPPAPTATAVPTATPTAGAPGPLSCTGSDRLVTVTNTSGRMIWVAALGSTDTAAPDPTSCTSHSDCVANEFCNSLVNPPQCSSVPLNGTIGYHPSSPTCASNSDCADSAFPVCYTGNSQCGSIPTDGNGFALANGAARTICVPTTWSGRLWARTGCNFTENANTTCAGSCQGQTVTVGAPCALSSDCQDACVGGTNNGNACTGISDCPGQCSGGSQSCTSDSDCTSPPHTCNLATCGHAFCQAGGSCCASGSCTGAQLTCSGGSNPGNLCTSVADCPSVCVAGTNMGASCATNSDCGTGGACSVGSCGANTFSLYCASSGAAPATLAELTLAAPGVCSGGTKSGGPCGSACTNGGGTCGDTTDVVAQSDFFDIQAGIDGPNLPAVITPVKGTYQITADLRGVDVNTTSCTSASDCSGTPKYSQCFSPPFNRKIFGPKEALCARSCSSDSDCTNAPYTKCFLAPSPFENLSPGICIQPCTSNSQCTGVSGDTVCDKTDGACVDPYECTSPGCAGGTACANAGPPGGPYLSACSWSVLGQACPSYLRIFANGKFAGCASACAQCQPGAAQPAVLDCSGATSLSWAPTNTDLYCCQGAVSCFSGAGATADNCCGYAIWAKCAGGSNPGAFCGNDADCAGGGTCTAMPLPQGQATPGFAAASGSGTWLTQAEPYTRKFKAGCPTAYAYQYDDSTSTFVCGGVSASKETEYRVTFMAPTAAAPTPTPTPTP